MKEWPLDPEDFASYYAFSPAALALREAVRLKAVREFSLSEPILDIGCGDGLFARLSYPDKQVWGVDINPDEIKRAQATATYRTLICGSICDVDLPKTFFGSAIANCSLEHVPDLGDALKNIRSSLRGGARFLLIVPTPGWSRHLALARALSAVGMRSAAEAYGDALDRVFKHVHLHDEAWWRSRLEEAGFRPIECRLIVSRATSWTFDVLLPPSAIGYAVKKVTGRWVVAPGMRSLSAGLVRRFIDLLQRSFPDGSPREAGEYLLVAEAR